MKFLPDSPKLTRSVNLFWMPRGRMPAHRVLCDDSARSLLLFLVLVAVLRSGRCRVGRYRKRLLQIDQRQPRFLELFVQRRNISCFELFPSRQLLCERLVQFSEHRDLLGGGRGIGGIESADDGAQATIQPRQAAAFGSAQVAGAVSAFSALDERGFGLQLSSSFCDRCVSRERLELRAQTAHL